MKLPEPQDELSLTIKILSCSDLLSADRNNFSDPYVKVILGKKDLHKTKHIIKTLNPVYGPETNHSCNAQFSFADLTAEGGLTFQAKDWDRIGSNEEIGIVTIKPEKIVALASSDGGEAEFAFDPPAKRSEMQAGYIKISVQLAPDPDNKYWKPPAAEPEPEPVVEPEPQAEAPPLEAEAEAPSEPSPDQVPDQDKELLIEIVSCKDLPSADKNGVSDPYVKIKLGKKDLHKTSHIKKTLNPVYSKEDKNTYILKTPAKTLWENGGLELKVMDWDRGIGGDDDLGSAMVPAHKLYYSAGDEMECPLDTNGTVTIKVREATLGDKDDFESSSSVFNKLPTSFKKEKTVQKASHENLQSLDFVDIADKILLVEIVSCRALLPADKNGFSDPYVKTKLDGKEIHETDHVNKTLNPVFTEKEKNSFVVDLSSSDLFGAGGLFIKVKDWDRGIGGNDDLGTCQVKGADLYECTEKEYKLSPPKGHSEDAGFVTIRTTEISEEERDARKKGGFLPSFIKPPSLPSLTSPKKKKKKRNVPSDFSILVEIVSCKGLIKAGKSGSNTDPYFVVKMGSEEIHKTEALSNTVDPIFTIKTGSLFILDVMKQEFLDNNEGLTFTGFDSDPGPLKDEELGFVNVSAEDLVKGEGERTVLKLQDKNGDTEKDLGTIALRWRPATNYDNKFMDFAADPKGDFLGVRQSLKTIFETKGGKTRLPGTKLSMTESSGPDAGVKKYRVRPEPDPTRAAVTKWLSEEELQKEAEEPSREWLHIGSGDLGKIYVEVIAADGLPNMESVMGKTDSFAMLVYEDAIARTDTIDDCLSPRWMPWSRRAFVFSIDHPSSDLFVGVFDHDKIGKHDLIGRAAIQVSRLRQNTEYVLTYHLYEDSFDPERVAKGSVTLRIRLEYDSPKAITLANLTAPRHHFVNLDTAKHLKLARDVVKGKTDWTAYSIGTLSMYLAELTSYKYVTYYISDGLISLLLWRGQVPLLFGIKIPLYSMIVFYMATTLVEKPTLCFAYFWFANAWLLLAVQSWRNNTPNAWNQTRPFIHLVRMMAFDSAAPPENIEKNFNEEEATEFDTHMKKRIERAEKLALERYEEECRLWAEHQAEIADLDQAGVTDISTRADGLAPSPFKPYLYPIQQYLAWICYWLRFTRNVYSWDESYLAFYLTVASLAIGVVFMIVPWAFLLRWLGRLIAYLVFGPHMKLVDMFWYSKFKELSEEEERQQLAEYYKSYADATKLNAGLARLQTEENMKLREVRKILYGSYVERVPVIKNERFIDSPLYSSYAKAYLSPKESSTNKIKNIHIGGQNLCGTMIPELRSIAEAKAKKKAAEEAKSAEEKAAPKIKRV